MTLVCCTVHIYFFYLSYGLFIGLHLCLRLTSYYGQYELRIELEDWDGQSAWALYSDFELVLIIK